jgi:hypothetical protein
MKRLRTAVVATALLAAVGVVAPVMAADDDLGTNPGEPNPAQNGNCIAYYSSAYIHNGAASTLGRNAAQGARGEEIKNLQQAACPPSGE